eukprot:821690-Alexandrium_andersonii.AAC.1
MEAGDAMEVTGGAKQIGMRNATARRNICWITNCKGAATRLEERPDLDQGSREWPYDEAWGGASGKKLDPGVARQAIEEDVKEFRRHGCYEKVPTEECRHETGKAPIQVRWIDINKGDEERPGCRSRLVAKEIKWDQRGDLTVVAEGAGFERGKEEAGVKLEFIDIKRAFVRAKARRAAYAELPPEDAEEGMCGLLRKSMYGAR